YVFHRRVSMTEAMGVLFEGNAVEYRITIPEGLTSEQIVARLRENDVLVGELPRTPREGSLMPDTYKFTRGTSRQQIIDQMTRLQTRALQDIWNRRVADLPVRSPEELVILASIVEKETAKADERPRVAGVFVNRLNRRMRLESDPTVIYGVVGGRGRLDRPISRADLDRLTPYNTYRVEGLPPTPIGNPGRASMEAVANPMRHREVFFVADGTGGHAFAETLDQHNRNVARWRQIERERGAASPAVLTAPAEATPRPAAAVPVGAAPPAAGAQVPALR
ncbi:MAG: endolytic transglycosylase MltG, partial [Alphaproteobacteria bacterium]